MDTRSIQTAPLDESTNHRHRNHKKKKLTKKQKKQLKKKRKALKSGHKYWEPLDKSNSITLHLVHRSTNDPLLNVPDIADGTNPLSEWVLEPEVKSRRDYERVQKFFGDYALEDAIPHSYRTDEFIEKTSVQSMPMLRTQLLRSGNTALAYDYSQHYRNINDSNFTAQKSETKKKETVMESYMFEQEYDSDYDNEEKCKDSDIFENESDYKAYLDLLHSDNEQSMDDLQDSFVWEAMGVSTQNKLSQIGGFEPYGARFGKWTEMDCHFDKYQNNAEIKQDSQSLYDRTINHLMSVQSMKNSAILDDISEESSQQFSDAESDCDSANGTTQTCQGSIAYNPELSLLDNTFEIMLNQYSDGCIGELSDDCEELRGDNTYDIIEKFTSKNKKESLRFQYYTYLRHKKRRVRQCLKKANRNVTLDLMAANHQISEKKNNKSESESDEIIYFSDSDSEKEHKTSASANVMDLDSDSERRINAEIDLEFRQKTPPKWDCESILSTRTNSENHPSEIRIRNGPKMERIKMELKTDKAVLESVDESESVRRSSDKSNGNNLDSSMEFCFGNIGGDIVKESKVESQNGIVFEFESFEDGIEYENVSMATNKGCANGNGNESGSGVTVFERKKGESKAEKRLRKRMQKDLKQQRRKEKKANKEAFKQARKKQNKLSVTQRKSHGSAIRL